MPHKKVIHIVESLHKGAVENWLIRMFEFGTNSGFELDWTFYCVQPFQGRQEERVLKLGAKVLHSENSWGKPFKLIKELKGELISGNYDVMHCHHDFMSALYLLASRNINVLKLVHVHNMDEHIPTQSLVKAKVLRYVFRQICWRLSDKIVGISNHVLDRFILDKNNLREKSRLLYYGVSHHLFLDSKVNKDKFHATYNIPANAKVVLFCARIDSAKNPLVALDIFKSLQESQKDCFMLMVGEGGLSANVEEKIIKDKLENSVKYIGWSDDIAFILNNSRVLLYPHVEYPMEGLGIIIVESQLSRLPIVSSIGVGEDAFFDKEYSKRLSLSDSRDDWTGALREFIDKEKQDHFSIMNKFIKSPFLMKTALQNLLNLYQKYE